MHLKSTIKWHKSNDFSRHAEKTARFFRSVARLALSRTAATEQLLALHRRQTQGLLLAETAAEHAQRLVAASRNDQHQFGLARRCGRVIARDLHARLGGGDLNALVGLIGFTGGILLGIASLKKGFSLKRSYEAHKAEGGVLPAVMAALLILVVTVPALFKFSEEGPGSMRAPFWIALVIALVVGALAQKSRLCMVGGLRDAFMLKDFHLLYGFVAIFVVTLVGNLAMGKFHLGFALQPIAHSAHLWNLLGMVLVGWGSVLLGGCPLRQLILAAQGNGDSAVTVFGMLVGAALAHNFGLAGNPDSKSEAGELIVGGISTAGKIAVVLGLVVMLVVVILNLPKKEEAKA